MAPSPRLSYLVTDQVPPFSQRMVVALTFDLLIKMASTRICHGRKKSSHHDRMATTLISDQVGTHPLITLEWPCAHNVRTHLIVISEWPSVLDQVFLVTNQAPPFQEWK